MREKVDLPVLEIPLPTADDKKGSKRKKEDRQEEKQKEESGTKKFKVKGKSAGQKKT